MTQRNHESAAAAKRYYTSCSEFCGTKSAALRKWMDRQANRPLPPAETGKYRLKYMAILKRRSTPVVVPLGSASAPCLHRVQRANPRLREWSHGVTASVLHCPYATYSTGSNSDWKKRSTFRRGAYIQSQATCTRDTATLVIMGEKYQILAPRGYRWDIDQHGLMLVGAAGEYHPTAGELLDDVATGGKGKLIAQALKNAAATRKAAKAEAKRKAKQQANMLRLAEREGATVCLADSRRAGNCLAGSEAWARQHGLDPRRHYAPSEVLRLANGDAGRVSIVVAMAIRRHREEMERGYANLADHAV